MCRIKGERRRRRRRYACWTGLISVCQPPAPSIAISGRWPGVPAAVASARASDHHPPDEGPTTSAEVEIRPLDDPDGEAQRRRALCRLPERRRCRRRDRLQLDGNPGARRRRRLPEDCDDGMFAVGHGTSEQESVVRTHHRRLGRRCCISASSSSRALAVAERLELHAGPRDSARGSRRACADAERVLVIWRPWSACCCAQVGTWSAPTWSRSRPRPRR